MTILTTDPAASNTKLQRILIVEYDPIFASGMQQCLKILPGSEIHIVLSGEEALQIAKQQPFDLLITEYYLPDTNGITLATQIRQLHPHIGIITITANGYNEVCKQAGDLIHRVVDKSVSYVEFHRTVSAVLADRS